MSDYISREAVEQIISAQCGECADTCLEFDGIQPDCNQCLLGGAAKAIKRIPAADVRPVVRGKWVNDHNGKYSPAGDNYFCSACKDPSLRAFGKPARTNFCPNCGADMMEGS